MVGEVKKCGADQSAKDDDRGKLYHMMKLALNRLIRFGVVGAKVLGFLVQGMSMVLL